ncbi:hypothetical protein ACIGDI_34430 [Streptomyces sp. NPDC085900]|uniref:hypothetical protein n=1 Tax=Streptomyces sp. NPDC085900 TaxID=3365737 RepID=UPI0037D22C70
MLVSAVDTNRARAELQTRYAPKMLSASTLDLHAEALRVGPPGISACLRCYNPPEAVTGGDELRERTRAGGTAAVRALAAEAGVAEADDRRWLGCGEMGNPAPELTWPAGQLPAGPVRGGLHLRLAAETVKAHLYQPLRAAAPSTTT